MSSGLISVIMPAYNAEKYLPRSIGSVQAQTYENWELLVVDDGSADGSAALVERIAAQDPRVKLLRNQHGGTARARNTALDVAKGEFLAFIDADDVFHPCFLQIAMEAMEREKAEMAVCGIRRGESYEEFFAAEPAEGYTLMDTNAAFAAMYGQDWTVMISPCNKVTRVSAYQNVRYPKGRYFEDAATTNLAVYNCQKICRLNGDLYFYHATPGSSSKTKRSVELLDREWALRTHWEHFLAQGNTELAYQALGFYLYELMIIFHKIQQSDRPEDRNIIRDRFLGTYRKFKRKLTLTPERERLFYEFAYPRRAALRRMAAEHGPVKAMGIMIKRKLGKER